MRSRRYATWKTSTYSTGRLARKPYPNQRHRRPATKSIGGRDQYQGHRRAQVRVATTSPHSAARYQRHRNQRRPLVEGRGTAIEIQKAKNKIRVGLANSEGCSDSSSQPDPAVGVVAAGREKTPGRADRW